MYRFKKFITLAAVKRQSSAILYRNNQNRRTSVPHPHHSQHDYHIAKTNLGDKNLEMKKRWNWKIANYTMERGATLADMFSAPNNRWTSSNKDKLIIILLVIICLEKLNRSRAQNQIKKIKGEFPIRLWISI